MDGAKVLNTSRSNGFNYIALPHRAADDLKDGVGYRVRTAHIGDTAQRYKRGIKTGSERYVPRMVHTGFHE